MIAKISRNWGVGGLVRYLMGPGKANEHTEQRVVGTWDWAPELHQPSRDGSVCGFDVRGLVQDLTLPAELAGVAHRRPTDEQGRRSPPVWHCSLRNAPHDRVLSDEEWAEVAEDLMDRTGITRRGDYGGCRWVAIRHADDHIHIAAVLVRQDDGRRVHPWQDYRRAGEVCRNAERRLGLTETAPPDRTAARRATRAEQEKAERRGADETSRTWLRRQVRTAAVQAQNPEDFFQRLADLGVKVRVREPRYGDVVGYAVAKPGDVNAAGQPVWFGGGRLAPDLSLPALLDRWRSAPPAPDPIPPSPHEYSMVGRAERAASVQQVTSAARDAAAALRADRENGPGVAHATADLLAALCEVTRRSSNPVPQAVSDEYDRAARTPMVRQPQRWPPVARELRRAAQRLARTRSVTRGHEDDSGTAELLVAIALLIAEIAAYHEERNCIAQAAAARRTHDAVGSYVTGLAPTSGSKARPPTREQPRRPAAPAASPVPRRPTPIQPVVRAPRPPGQGRGRSR